MGKVERTRRTRVDMLQIWVYVAERNPPAADRVISRLNADIATLGRNSMIGESIDHLAPGLRRFASGNYVILFRPLENGVRLVRVVHASRSITEVLDGIDEAREP